MYKTLQTHLNNKLIYSPKLTIYILQSFMQSYTKKNKVMKKLLLIVLVILANVSYSQFSNKGCGWKYQSTQNVTYYTDGRPKEYRNGNIELYYNETCEKFLRICYVNGSNEYYYPTSESPIVTDRTVGGYVYNLYNLKDYVTNQVINLQIIYSTPAVIRIHYSDGYVEFY